MGQQKEHQFQYTEFWEGRTGLTFGLREILFSRQSDFQHVQVLETDAFGRLLTLDGLVMTTDRDEFVYHEMIAHPALCLLTAPRRALVVGGGDGGTVREILRHASIAHVDLVEIDGMVIDVARTFFPRISAALDDPRLSVHVADGIAFVKEAPAGTYDLVVVDSTDPVGIAEGLFGEAFYRDCARILTEQGVLVSQSESPFDRAFQGSIRGAHDLLTRMFARAFTYLAFIPTYPLGMWSFLMATRGLHPLDDYDAAEAARRLAPFADALQYYNPDVHRGAFALPNFVRRSFEG
jgi:spermidine synthase